MLTAEAQSTNNIQLNWRIADGYYLYKQRIKLEPADTAQPVGALVLPKGEDHTATNISASRRSIGRVSMRRSRCRRRTRRRVDVNVTYQGCADAGLCYPPHDQAGVDLARRCADRRGAAPTAALPPADSSPSRTATPRRSRTATSSWCSLSFFGAGLLLAFTPCVLPMVPILSGIIAGSGENVTTRRSFMLSRELRARHGVHVHRGGHRGRRHRPGFQPAGHVQPALDRGCFSACCSWCWRPRCSACSPSRCRASSRHGSSSKSNEQQAGTYRRRRRHGRAVGAHRLRLRRAAADRGAHGHQPDRRRGARRLPRCS